MRAVIGVLALVMGLAEPAAGLWSPVNEPGQGDGFQVISGRADFESGHIPTAGFADLMGELADGSSPYRFAVPAPERFAAAMGALGVGDGSRVVLYSGNDPGWAARVWWMLRWIGFDRAALLDGGLKTWNAEGRPLSTEPADRPARRLTVSLRPQLIADSDEVRAAIGNEAVTLVDSLPEASFQGTFALYGRAGHIPGAINIPATSLVDELGHYLPQEQLAATRGGDAAARIASMAQHAKVPLSGLPAHRGLSARRCDHRLSRPPGRDWSPTRRSPSNACL